MSKGMYKQTLIQTKSEPDCIQTAKSEETNDKEAEKTEETENIWDFSFVQIAIPNFFLKWCWKRFVWNTSEFIKTVNPVHIKRVTFLCLRHSDSHFRNLLSREDVSNSINKVIFAYNTPQFMNTINESQFKIFACSHLLRLSRSSLPP